MSFVAKGTEVDFKGLKPSSFVEAVKKQKTPCKIKDKGQSVYVVLLPFEFWSKVAGIEQK